MSSMLHNTTNPRAAALLIFLIRHRVPVLKRLWQIFLGCDIECAIPNHIMLPHPYGIVVHSSVVLGANVVLMQQSTIGARDVDGLAPAVEDEVFVGAGARVLGGIRIGHHAKIGANAVVTKDVPPYATAVGYNRIILRDLPPDA
jgi:serine O-acetyltransferase